MPGAKLAIFIAELFAEAALSSYLRLPPLAGVLPVGVFRILTLLIFSCLGGVPSSRKLLDTLPFAK